MLMGAFMHGLKDEIKAELKLLSTGSLDELMSLAKKVEARRTKRTFWLRF